MFLRPYFAERGPRLEDHRADLELLRDRAREILTSPAQVRARLEGGLHPYNRNDFSFTSTQAASEGAKDCLEVGQRVALAVANVLSWPFIVAPEHLERLDWNLFYTSIDGFEGESYPMEEFHSDGFSQGGFFGVWVPDPRLASFRLLGSTANPNEAFCQESVGPSSSFEVSELLNSRKAVIRRFEGNTCLHLPRPMVHDREKIDFAAAGAAAAVDPQAPRERWAFRIRTA